VPATSADAVRESGNVLSVVGDIKISGNEGGYVVLQVGSGLYHFTATQ